MAKFRKKPVVIEAVQWNGNNKREVIEFCDGLTSSTKGKSRLLFDAEKGEVIGIKTLEGIMTAMPGDWIIKGVHGEYYPCKPDIFEATYEQVKVAGSTAKVEILKKDISNILQNALGGYTAEYRTADGFIKWGKVERAIHQAIDTALW